MLNLNGGLLATGFVLGGPNAAVYLNGGTLQANSANAPPNTQFLQAGNAYVGAGGAVLDTQNFNISIPQNLQHDAADLGAAADGGLVKLGTGKLALVGTSTYSGPTTISAGTLELDGDGENLPTATALTIASGGVFDLAGNPQTVGSLSGSAGAIVTNSQLLQTTLDVDGGSVLRLDDVRREHHRQQCAWRFPAAAN